MKRSQRIACQSIERFNFGDFSKFDFGFCNCLRKSKFWLKFLAWQLVLYFILKPPHNS